MVEGLLKTVKLGLNCQYFPTTTSQESEFFGNELVEALRVSYSFSGSLLYETRSGD